MAYKVNTRFIGTNHKEYKSGDIIPDDVLDEKYAGKLKVAGILSDASAKDKKTAQKSTEPLVPVRTVDGDGSPESMATTVGTVSGETIADENIEPSEQNVGTVGEILPDPTTTTTANLDEGAGDYHLPVGTVNGDAPTETMPEAEVVGSVEPALTVAKKRVNN